MCIRDSCYVSYWPSWPHHSSRRAGLNKSATNIPSACRIANITLNDAMFLPYYANPGRIEFSERTTPQKGALLIWPLAVTYQRSLAQKAFRQVDRPSSRRRELEEMAQDLLRKHCRPNGVSPDRSPSASVL